MNSEGPTVRSPGQAQQALLLLASLSLPASPQLPIQSPAQPLTGISKANRSGGIKGDSERGWGEQEGAGALTGNSLLCAGHFLILCNPRVTDGMMGNGRPERGKGLAQGHTASQRQNQCANPGDPAPSHGFSHVTGFLCA